MADTYTYANQKSVKHTVNAGEAGSGIAFVTVYSNPHTTDDWLYQINVKNSGNKDKTNGIDHFYNTASGVVHVLDGDTTVDEDDIITLTGHFV